MYCQTAEKAMKQAKDNANYCGEIWFWSADSAGNWYCDSVRRCNKNAEGQPIYPPGAHLVYPQPKE